MFSWRWWWRCIATADDHHHALKSRKVLSICHWVVPVAKMRGSPHQLYWYGAHFNLTSHCRGCGTNGHLRYHCTVQSMCFSCKTTNNRGWMYVKERESKRRSDDEEPCEQMEFPPSFLPQYYIFHFLCTPILFLTLTKRWISSRKKNMERLKCFILHIMLGELIWNFFFVWEQHYKWRISLEILHLIILCPFAWLDSIVNRRSD